METFKKIIKNICKKNNIEFFSISNDWVILLKKQDKYKCITGYKFDLNSQALSKVLDDKYATYEYLKCVNVPVVPHNIVYSSVINDDFAKKYQTYEYLIQLYNKYNKRIVLKINDGSCGKNVYKIDSILELKKQYELLKSSKKSYSICPFYEIENEYRIIVLDKKIEFMYKKELPIIYGDGSSTIKELLVKFNPFYFKEKQIDNGDVILKKNEKYQYGWKFNSSCGSRPTIDISDQIKQSLVSFVNNILAKVDLKFGSIDIIKVKDEYYILEINSGVMMDYLYKEIPNGKQIVEEIYTKAINKMFEN